jgi:hypothetical protein
VFATTGVTSQGQCVGRACRGYAMAALLMGLSVMSVMLTMAVPVWHTVVRREREDELIFRGRQYVRAIELFQRKYGGTFPPTIDLLLEGRFLRHRYLDPITRGEFQLLYVGVPEGVHPGAAALPVATDGRRGILGVVSRSTERSLRLYEGRGRYNQWMFVVDQTKATGSGGVESKRPSPDRGSVQVGASR